MGVCVVVGGFLIYIDSCTSKTCQKLEKERKEQSLNSTANIYSHTFDLLVNIE